MELYVKVRRAVLADGMSRRGAARYFGIDRKTVDKILVFPAPPEHEPFSADQPAYAAIPSPDGLLEEHAPHEAPTSTDTPLLGDLPSEASETAAEPVASAATTPEPVPAGEIAPSTELGPSTEPDATAEVALIQEHDRNTEPASSTVAPAAPLAASKLDQLVMLLSRAALSGEIGLS